MFPLSLHMVRPEIMECDIMQSVPEPTCTDLCLVFKYMYDLTVPNTIIQKVGYNYLVVRVSSRKESIEDNITSLVLWKNDRIMRRFLWRKNHCYFSHYQRRQYILVFFFSFVSKVLCFPICTSGWRDYCDLFKTTVLWPCPGGWWQFPILFIKWCHNIGITWLPSH